MIPQYAELLHSGKMTYTAHCRRTNWQVVLYLAFFALGLIPVYSQSTGAGVLHGVVVDGTGAPVPAAKVEILPAIKNSDQVTTAPDGSFSFGNVPFGDYRLRVMVSGFQPYVADLHILSTTPVEVQVRLALAGQQTTVLVEATPENLTENVPAATNKVDRSTLAQLPGMSQDSGLNDAILLTTPSIAADSNGFFHPLGDHAQVSYVIDGQPVSDQRNKVFSTSIPANAIQSMDIISGSPNAEFGDKTSLIVNAATRSGLGQKPGGSFITNYGSFGTLGEEATLTLGNARSGNFISFNTQRTGRFLDTPEFRPMHGVGNMGTLFDRVDFRPTAKDAFHVNLLAARNWFQVPNTYDQPNQDQRQRVLSFNIAPSLQHVFDGQTLLAASAFFRSDQVDYYPSRNPMDDLPATLAQDRRLSNYGFRADISHIQGRHNLKAGFTLTQTQLRESFRLGITDPLYNAVCLSENGKTPVSGFTDPARCAGMGLAANPAFLSGLLPYDLTRGGNTFHFQGKATISQVSYFGQDSIRWGNLALNLGLRMDYYNGLTRGNGVQPRGVFSYFIQATKTVLRGGYSHTLETPANENLVASSSTGAGGLANSLFHGAAEERPLALGSRNQYDAGIQQSFGKWLLVDVSYFRKYTRNAYDFDALFSTPITFPISWKQSKLDGVGARLSTPDIHGFRAYATMGHANARFFGPENGGIIFNSDLAEGAFRMDHEQVYQQNVNFHYQHSKGGWAADFVWRYDSGLVVGAVNSMADALTLTAAQQSAIGLFCGNQRAYLGAPITTCDSPHYGAERIEILAPGAENNDHNPPRAKGRHTFDLGIGTDNLFRQDRIRTTLRFTIMNLSNQAALYNFLSPFSGTHWITPRTFQVQLGWVF